MSPAGIPHSMRARQLLTAHGQRWNRTVQAVQGRGGGRRRRHLLRWAAAAERALPLCAGPPASLPSEEHHAGICAPTAPRPPTAACKSPGTTSYRPDSETCQCIAIANGDEPREPLSGTSSVGGREAVGGVCVCRMGLHEDEDGACGARRAAPGRMGLGVALPDYGSGGSCAPQPTVPPRPQNRAALPTRRPNSTLSVGSACPDPNKLFEDGRNACVCRAGFDNQFSTDAVCSEPLVWRAVGAAAVAPCQARLSQKARQCLGIPRVQNPPPPPPAPPASLRLCSSQHARTPCGKRGTASAPASPAFQRSAAAVVRGARHVGVPSGFMCADFLFSSINVFMRTRQDRTGLASPVCSPPPPQCAPRPEQRCPTAHARASRA
jgi:hypothetical protein